MICLSKALGVRITGMVALLLLTVPLLAACGGGTTTNAAGSGSEAVDSTLPATPQATLANLPNVEFDFPASLGPVQSPASSALATQLSPMNGSVEIGLSDMPATKGNGWLLIDQGNVNPQLKELLRVLQAYAAENDIPIDTPVTLPEGELFGTMQPQGTLVLSGQSDDFKVAWAIDSTSEGTEQEVDVLIHVKGVGNDQTIDVDVHVRQAGDELRILLATSTDAARFVQRVKCLASSDAGGGGLCDGASIELFSSAKPSGDGTALVSRFKVPQLELSALGWGNDAAGGVWRAVKCLEGCELLPKRVFYALTAVGREYYGTNGAVIRTDIGTADPPIVVAKGDAENIRGLLSSHAVACVEDGPPPRLEFQFDLASSPIAINLNHPEVENCSVEFDVNGDGSGNLDDFEAAFTHGELGWKDPGGATQTWTVGDATYISGRITAVDTDANTATMELVRLYSVDNVVTLFGHPRHFQAQLPVRALLPLLPPARLYSKPGEAVPTFEGSSLSSPIEIWVDTSGDGLASDPPLAGDDLELINGMHVVWRDTYTGSGPSRELVSVPTLRVYEGASAELDVPAFFDGAADVAAVVSSVNAPLAALESDLDDDLGLTTPPLSGVPRSRLTGGVPSDDPLFNGLR
jgi:hypothetical protein